ncbi:MAG: nickel pincer cofactor biosynthesis protein LarB, partial [bacterium]
ALFHFTSCRGQSLHQAFPSLNYSETSRIATANIADRPALHYRVLVLCAGTSDLPVAHEAAQIARIGGCDVEVIADCGVAGIHRLTARQAELESADLLIVVAGMEGALPSVVAGLTSVPVVAVPTSVGYGTGLDGYAALLTMLNSCAAGIVVVNIDNGFGAGIFAVQVARQNSRGTATPP